MGRRRRSKRFQSINKCSSSCYGSDSESHDKKKQKSNGSESCEVISKLLLPEHLMLSILRLVPLNCLLNSAMFVSKPWATIILSSHFAEACLHHQRSKPGLYVENLNSESSSYFLDIKDCVNGQFQFERTDLGTPPRMGTIISNCDGILLLFQGPTRTFVVNPIIKCWLRIPPLPISQKRLQLVHQFTIARVPRTAKFKLFFIDILEASDVFWYVFYVLRVGIDNSWKEIARKKAPREWYNCWKPLYNGGNYLYWITIQRIIVVDVDKEIIVGEISPPPVPMDHRPLATFLWMGHRFSCIVCKDAYYKTFQIFILDSGSGKWSLYHEMGPFDYVEACGHELKVCFMAFRLWINDQIIFRVVIPPLPRERIYMRRKTIHFSYNVKTRQLTKIEGIVVGNIEVWLHTNSLVSLPSTPT